MIPPSTLAVGPALAASNVDEDEGAPGWEGWEAWEGWTIVEDGGPGTPGVSGAGRDSWG
jgi:hypothetical protein